MNDLKFYSERQLQEELDRRAQNAPQAKPVVTYQVGVHGDSESATEAAYEAGLTEEEIEEMGLSSVGYEVILDVTVDRQAKTWTTDLSPASQGLKMEKF